MILFKYSHHNTRYFAGIMRFLGKVHLPCRVTECDVCNSHKCCCFISARTSGAQMHGSAFRNMVNILRSVMRANLRLEQDTGKIPAQPQTANC
jgi:hypothetical protein